jgi:hypothetical protein
MIHLGFCPDTMAQVVGMVGYVTHDGEAFLKATPGERLQAGQELEKSDVIILAAGARVRLDFYPVSQSKIFSADAEIHVNKALDELKNAGDQKDKKGAVLAELDRLKRRYFAPRFSQYAGTRSLDMLKTNVIHSVIKSYRADPYLVYRTFGNAPEAIVLFRSDNKEVFRMAAPARNGISVVHCKAASLTFGQSYLWMLDPQGAQGTLEICSQQQAAAVRNTLSRIKRDALDNVDALTSSALYLHNTGFWAKAYDLVEQALALQPNDNLLQNLKTHILQYSPDDPFYQDALAQSDSILIDFTFHIFHDGRRREVQSGDTVYTGDQLQIGLKAQQEQDIYLYLLNLDAGGNLYVLYPFKGKDHFIAAGSEIFIPSKVQYYLADAQVGKEIIYVVASHFPLDFLGYELDRILAETTSQSNIQMLENIASRGFSAVTQPQKGDAEKDAFKRMLKGRGLFVRKIVLNHL